MNANDQNWRSAGFNPALFCWVFELKAEYANKTIQKNSCELENVLRAWVSRGQFIPLLMHYNHTLQSSLKKPAFSFLCCIMQSLQ